MNIHFRNLHKRIAKKHLLPMATVALSLCAASSMAQTYNNPVIHGVADAGCIKYAGKYYLGGVATYGDLFVSSDLVNWGERVHVFDFDNQWTKGTGAKNNQIHANDMSYSGGQFHLLFSANYWGKDKHIVHITHAVSPTVTGPYREVRDDQWFENRIDPMAFRDEDGRLYLYMVKFTDGNTIWGRPMNQDFTFSGDAVQQFSSQPGTWETYDNRVAEGPFVIKYRGRYYMMYNANHTSPSFGNYRLGVCEASSPLGFGPGGKYSWPVVGPNTEPIDDTHADLLHYGSGQWQPLATDNSGDIGNASARTMRFDLASVPAGNVYLKLIQRGGISVKINGHAINAGKSSDYQLYPINHSWLKKGVNTLVIEQPKEGKGTLSSIALYDFGNEKADDLLVTPGQPNIVRGPNGWEWWLVYMANKGWQRSQYIDRIHFSNGRMVVDGITGPNTAGFHPAPSKPQYAGTSIADISFSSTTYLLELTMSSAQREQGIVIGDKTVLLPDSMARNVVHEWRIEKNHNLLTVWIDKVLVTQHQRVNVTDNKVKLLGDSNNYHIDHVAYNEGFDEYGPYFSGWDTLTAGTHGLALNKGMWLKGAAANNYELSVQTDDNDATSGAYGVMAAYTDNKNYVSVKIDAAKAQVVIDHCVKGKTKSVVKPLATEQVVYPDVKYTDSFEKQYRFDSDTYINALLFPHNSPDNDPYAHDLGIEAAVKEHYQADVASSQEIAWLDGDTWRPLSTELATSSNPAWQRITFPTVKTRGLRFINREATDMHRNIYRIKVGSERQTVNQLRVERRGKDIHVYVNDRSFGVVTLAHDVPTRCGLVSDGAAKVTVGNVLYYVVN